MIVTIRSSSSDVISPALGFLSVPFVPLRGFRIPLVQIHIGLLAHKVGVSSAHTLDSGQGVHDLLLAIDVGIEQTQDELEVRLFAADESCCNVSEHFPLESSSVRRLNRWRPLQLVMGIDDFPIEKYSQIEMLRTHDGQSTLVLMKWQRLCWIWVMLVDVQAKF